MKKKLSCLILLCLCQLFFVSNHLAQNSYSFSKITNSTYTNLSGDITVPGFDPNTGLFTFTNFQNETFEFFDLGFTFGGAKTIAMGEYPFLRIDNDSSLIIVDAAFTYLDSIDPTSKKSYLIQGGPGNRILKLQYKNFKLSSGQAGNFINVQIWYSQKTGVIEIHYGPRSANNVSGYNTVTGPNVGIFYSPDDFSSCYEKLWVKGSPANVVLDSAATLVFNAMSGVADEGTVYRFTPRFIEPEVTTSTAKIPSSPAFLISPNPAENKITIKGDFGNSRLQLSGPNGKILKQFDHLNLPVFEIDVADLPPGLYIMLIYEGKHIISKKISVTR